MTHNLELESLVTFRDLNPTSTRTFPIKGLVPYCKSQVVGRSVSNNSIYKLYKVENVRDVFLSDSESVLCRRIINLREII